MCSEEDTFFLTYREALEAIRSDFHHYISQQTLFLKLSPLILEPFTFVVGDGRNGQLWIKKPDKSQMHLITESQLKDLLLETLMSENVSLSQLADICAIVFQTNATLKAPCKGRPKGILLESGLKNFQCTQCGKCCSTLDYHKELSEKDYKVWESLDRRDIMKWVGTVERADKSTSYHIWMIPGTNRYASSCPFLKRINHRHQYACQIHDVKPKICRDYPGSRKHAVMTGCPVF